MRCHTAVGCDGDREMDKSWQVIAAIFHNGASGGLSNRFDNEPSARKSRC
jgi:hypothetical protein